MHATDFGRTLIIANPAAQSGAAREVAEHLQRFLDMTARASQFDLVLTERMGHAKELAAQAQDYRTVIALGGDGVIHEVVNGLWRKRRTPAPLLQFCPWAPATISLRRSVSTISPAKILARCSPASCNTRISDAFAHGTPQAAAARRPSSITTRRFRSHRCRHRPGHHRAAQKDRLDGRAALHLSGLEQFGLRYRNYPMQSALTGRPPSA